MMPTSLKGTPIQVIAEQILKMLMNSDEIVLSEISEKILMNIRGKQYSLEPVVLKNQGHFERFFILIIEKERMLYSSSETCFTEFNLTDRETEIAKLILDGYSNKNMAEKLHLSISTVKIHVSNIFHKLNVHTRIDAVKILTKV